MMGLYPLNCFRLHPTNPIHPKALGTTITCLVSMSASTHNCVLMFLFLRILRCKATLVILVSLYLYIYICVFLHAPVSVLEPPSSTCYCYLMHDGVCKGYIRGVCKGYIHVISEPDSQPKGEGESGTVAYRKPLWATACMRIPKCQLKVIRWVSRRC